MRPTRVNIDLDAVARNVQAIRRAAPGELCAVIKADAYGHGAVALAKALRAEGVAWLAVALVEEACVLRHAGVSGRLLVLGADYRDSFVDLVAHQLTPMVGTTDEIDGLAAAAKALGKQAECHIEVDTGMSRLGVLPEHAHALAAHVASTPHVRLSGLMTHFSHADVTDSDITKRQVTQFEATWRQIQPIAPSLRHRHLVSSGAVGRAGSAPTDILRCGLAVYGVQPVVQAPLAGLQPVLSWVTRPVSLRTIAQGSTVSYRGRWQAARPTRIATLPVGYGDGYPRLASHRAHVLVRGQRVPVVGTICMDLMMVDVTDIDSAKSPISTEDEVVLLGTQHNDAITAHELGAWAETIAYEILSGIGPRTPRSYRGGHAS